MTYFEVEYLNQINSYYTECKLGLVAYYLNELWRCNTSDSHKRHDDIPTTATATLSSIDDDATTTSENNNFKVSAS